MRKNTPVLVIVFLLFPAALLYGWRVYAPSDDTYIFLVYVRNFLDGNGLTYNGTVVEGFTSVFWVFLLTVFGALGIRLPELAAGLSMVSGLLALLATYHLAVSMDIQPGWLALMPPFLLALTGDFAFYSVVGLEEVLFTALVTFNLALLLSKPIESLFRSNYYPALLAVMILTRPEGALICALFFLIVLRRQTFPLILQCGIKLSLFLLPILVAKWAYYGYWLPNTWYAKAGAGLANAGQGSIYVLFNGSRYISVMVVMAALVILMGFRRQPLPKQVILPPALIVVIWLSYITLQGGDNMVGGRFLLPILPIVYSILIRAAQQARLRQTAIAATSFVLGLFLLLAYITSPGIQAQANSWREVFETRKKAGLYLREHYPPDTLVALNQAGIIPYYSQLPTIDMLGLNDVHIAHYGKRDYTLWYAHQAGDGEYVLSQKPDIIIFGGRGLNAQPGEFISDKEIWASQQFHNEYVLTEWEGIGPVYVRKESQ
jgi:arabinofuranosyltransferase